MADYQQYAVSVIDSDGDDVLNAAAVQAANFQAASESSCDGVAWHWRTPDTHSQ
jgi:hypothetical protein